MERLAKEIKKIVNQTPTEDIKKLERVSKEYNKKVDDGIFQTRGYNLQTIESVGRISVAFNA